MMFEEYHSYFGYYSRYCTELCVFADFPLLSFVFFDLPNHSTDLRLNDRFFAPISAQYSII